MIAHLKRLGNGRAIYLDKTLLAQLGIDDPENQEVDIQVVRDALVIRRAGSSSQEIDPELIAANEDLLRRYAESFRRLAE
ncbi:MAG: hypothetical protein ACF8XB_21485 [Planctomycetota bacterium JB042]